MKSRKTLLGAGLLGLVILTWVAIFSARFLFDPTVPQWVMLVTVGAIVTEVALWVGVALLGLTALNRFRIWERLRGKRLPKRDDPR